MILSAGLSPAWQSTLLFDRVERGEVNRARESHWIPSGKVINAARVAHRIHEHWTRHGERGTRAGFPSQGITILGGPAGEAMQAALRAEGIAMVAVPVATPSRVCTTVIDASDRVMTELVENAGPISPAELESFVAAFQGLAPSAKFAVLTGSMPKGAPANLYRRLMESLRCPVVLDIRGPELTEALALRPFLVKPNREELARTVGRPLANDAVLRRAMRSMHERGAEWVVVSQGKGSLLASGRGKFFQLRPPHVVSLNPIGCGDSLAAGIAQAVARGDDPLDAIRFGMALGAENATTLLPAVFDVARAAVRVSEVAVEELPG